MKENSRLHISHAGATFCLILTGLLLYSQYFRGTLAELRIYLHYAHIIFGGVFVITLAAYIRLFAMNWARCTGQNNRKLMSLVFVILATGAFLSGFLLFFKVDLVAVTGISTLKWHKGLATIGIMAVLYHTLAVWLHSKTNLPVGQVFDDAQGGLRTNRRVFIHWAASAGALLGGAMTYKWLLGGATGKNVPQGMAKRFKDCNKMNPQPVPGLGSLPPAGGGYKGEFEVFTVTGIPCANSDSWQFRLFGLVDKPLTIAWKEFLEIPRKVQISDFYCVTGWTVYHVTYEGIPLARLLDMGGTKPQANFVKFYSSDDVYTSALSLKQARLEDVMIAVLMDGEPIPSDLGGPARLIMPKMYAYKGVKWVNAIELVNEPYTGYWESRGYENDAWVTGKQ